ncbi:MAG: ATP-binding protein [Candidatus Omnitrophica bacterium]|nr:ATP-binding protein [Candidatus Omnitrophota bacterium]
MEDSEILRRAHEKENDSRNRYTKPPYSWTYFSIGASQRDVKRLLDEGYIQISEKYDGGPTKYLLTEKGKNWVWATSMEREYTKIEVSSILEAMDLIIGFDDIKETIAYAINQLKRINFLLEGPPACAKSLMLEAVRMSVRNSEIAFGSRTSAAGLSELLFEKQPQVLLLDEVDKMDGDTLSVLLGLMETGEILETKAKKTRGIKINCLVLAACNSSKKFPREILSRFAMHINFPEYTRQEFIDVCRGFLSKAENCPPDIAEKIGRTVYERQLGDVRRARGIWELMQAPTDAELDRIVGMMTKYSARAVQKRNAAIETRLPGI